jgi:broad specificity polyphosphatase/5'/3'-nucleotidase SurE
VGRTLRRSGFGATPNYVDAADYAYNLVELFRTKRSFRKKMVERQAPYNGIVLNINFPTCPSGAVRGVKTVPVGFLTQVTGYQLLSDVAGVKTWQVLSTAGNIVAVDCASTLEDPATDLQAFNVGFAAVTPLGAERTASGAKVKAFRFTEKVPF